MKKKQLFIIAAAGMVVAASTISVWALSQQEDTPASNMPITVAYDGGAQYEESAAEDYQSYTQYGLSYDPANDILTYQGQTVRYFIDQYSIDENSIIAVSEYFNEDGTIDLYTERDQRNIKRNADGSYDPSGILLGIKPYSQEEFAARDLDALKNPVSSGAESGDPMSREEKAALYDEYKAFGLTYNMETDRLIYQGKLVRYFLDVRSSNGKSMTGGGFEGSMTTMINDEKGEVDLYTVRDFNRLNGDGEGTLTGIEQYSQKEFDRRTDDWSK